ncbi:hypothetical protein BCF59_0494 [Mycoplasmopsis mustelae]|uniref:Uncharacterized protein n=1 Tax=Mycoplasmopsis mustelae TaxID=171289 RepID=A0A4R7UD69_9BACT|nr:hypothetical protein [Mycoplasmopsis mustelae]TDV23505.1 hypothetical protein BCF59_0494 [Mycoplasmopsis mustelae]
MANFKTNAGNKLFIALSPDTAISDDGSINVSAARFSEIEHITALKLNYSPKKEDKVYYHNNGESTSITTGLSKSLSVSIDFDNSSQAHQYLLSLLLGDVHNVNNQVIMLEIHTISAETNKFVTVSGKATINFKNHFPSGNADELQKLEFDILPQDNKWTTTNTPKTNSTQAHTGV